MPAVHEPPSLIADILLFVATGTEKDALEKTAKGMGFTFKRLQGTYGRYYDLGLVGPNRILAVKTEMGPLSYGGSASKAIYCRTETSARTLITVGMAFGIDRGTQKLGDVLVSTWIVPYDNRLITKPGDALHFSYERAVPHPVKPSILRALEGWAEAAKDHSVHFGSMLSGGAQIQAASYRDKLAVLCPRGEASPIIGGEMEGVGLLSASPPDDPLCLVVKGICDFADEERNKEIEAARKLASMNAARFLLGALSKITSGEPGADAHG